MKCDVCGTKISVGSHECPNCGYKYDQYASHYDMASATHEHIQYSSKRSIDVNRMKRVIGLVGAVFGVACLVISFALSMFLGDKDALTFQDAIDKGYDNGTIELALEAEKEIVKTTSKYEPQIHEYYFKENDRVSAQLSVLYLIDDIEYRINHFFENNREITKRFEIKGYTTQGIQNKDKLINKDLVSLIGNYFGYDYAYEDFNEMRLFLTNNVSGHEVTRDDWKLNISQDDISTDEEKMYYFVYVADK